MLKIDDGKVASILFEMHWESDEAEHTELLYGHRVNIWRDAFPRYMGEALYSKGEGDMLNFDYAPGEAVPALQDRKVIQAPPGGFERRKVQGRDLAPRRGRIYPSGLLARVTGATPQDLTPFRVGEVSPDGITADFNHPLADRHLNIKAHVLKIAEKHREPGGESKLHGDLLTSGPGFQARWHGAPTDFYADDPFLRADEAPDQAFYKEPRITAHIDKQAQDNLAHLLSGLLHPHTQVLDLMSGSHTHIPEELYLKELVGLGMNEQELRANRKLSAHVTHDLNERPELPFDDNRFDAVVCNMSVEYLTQPHEVFREAARVLRPGGAFIVTFSNRWFPAKAVRIWTELHEFERPGLVLDYFLESGRFERLHTWSERNWPRAWDPNDRYIGKVWQSDPLYAVWGRTRK